MTAKVATAAKGSDNKILYEFCWWQWLRLHWTMLTKHERYEAYLRHSVFRERLKRWPDYCQRAALRARAYRIHRLSQQRSETESGGSPFFHKHSFIVDRSSLACTDREESNRPFTYGFTSWRKLGNATFVATSTTVTRRHNSVPSAELTPVISQHWSFRHQQHKSPQPKLGNAAFATT